jgi:hypothetical protein
MRGVPSPTDGGVYHRGFGIKKRSWFGGRSRPAFMEPMPPSGGPQGVPQGVPPPCDGNYVRLVEGGGVGGGGALQRNKRKRSSSFPLKDDAGYIGYLTDDDDSGSSSGSSSDEGRRMVRRRRRELIGSDISFSACMFMMFTACGLLMLFLFAVSPWGVPPPRRLGAP